MYMLQGQGSKTRDTQYTNIHGARMLSAKLIATEVCRFVGANLPRKSTHAHTFGGDFELKILHMHDFLANLCQPTCKPL